MRWAEIVMLILAAASGCGGDARVDLSAADGIRAAAGQMELTLREYHQEVSRYDDSRESAVIAAFVTRVRKDNEDEAALDKHSTEFQTAMSRIRGDREVEYTRQSAARDNVSVLRELAGGLERLGIESLSLQDEVKRYLSGRLDAKHRAEAAARQRGGNP
ncbi:MAG TPA: hypothetical protein VLM89_12275 [Phycisphaerae bacterium]|nr:hypothetical protein [Phycisphaerae bacterium]